MCPRSKCNLNIIEKSKFIAVCRGQSSKKSVTIMESVPPWRKRGTAQAEDISQQRSETDVLSKKNIKRVPKAGNQWQTEVNRANQEEKKGGGCARDLVNMNIEYSERNKDTFHTGTSLYGFPVGGRAASIAQQQWDFHTADFPVVSQNQSPSSSHLLPLSHWGFPGFFKINK